MPEPLELPTYDQLPVIPGAPPGSSWGVWGDHDVFGCLNLLTPECVARGSAAIRDGTVFSLNLELELPAPPLFGRSAFRHDVAALGASAHDDSLSDWNTQASSQWDGFRHVGHPVHGFYGGVADEDHGMHHWARRGIAGRAVICDVDRYRAAAGRPIDCAAADAITAADITAALDSQGVQVEPGDILLLHTGWVNWYRTLGPDARAALAAAGRAFAAPGLVPGTDAARLLWDLHIAAIASDNPAVEMCPLSGHLTPEQRAEARADPDRMHEAFLHHSLLPLLGLPLGELWDLGPLAEACASDRRWTCLLTSAPLNLEAGVASPPNALAIR